MTLGAYVTANSLPSGASIPMGIDVLKPGLLVYRPPIIFFVLKGRLIQFQHQKARLHFPEMLCDETNSDTYYDIATELPIERIKYAILRSV
jgi:hypothetical protein